MEPLGKVAHQFLGHFGHFRLNSSERNKKEDYPGHEGPCTIVKWSDWGTKEMPKPLCTTHYE